MENLLIGDILTETPSASEQTGSEPEQNKKEPSLGANMGVQQQPNHYVREPMLVARLFASHIHYPYFVTLFRPADARALESGSSVQQGRNYNNYCSHPSYLD
jgi:hypothetical protein